MNANSNGVKRLFGKTFVIGLVVLVLALSIVIVFLAVDRSIKEAGPENINVLTGSSNSCVQCHQTSSPGIVEQFGVSSMARANVICEDCHVVAENYPGAVAHEGTFVLQTSSTKMCEKCHAAEVSQFSQSRHSLPSYVAYNGTEGMTEEQMIAYQSIPEGLYAPDKSRSQLYELEGEAITEFACKTCHDIGKPSLDGSAGQCQKCHLRHEFSLEQVRKPETCNACHIGPDHPQWEIYQESPHGITYATMGHTWNWEAESGTLDVIDFPAATCQICHMSGFGGTSTTHDVGERLAWYLFAPISERRPSWQDNLARMQSVCLECHNSTFVQTFYQKADDATLAVNDFIEEANLIRDELDAAGLLTDEPFDEIFDYAYYESWHHWGRTAKFGVWMQGPDYTQWHGAYEVLRSLTELEEIAAEKMENGK